MAAAAGVYCFAATQLEAKTDNSLLLQNVESFAVSESEMFSHCESDETLTCSVSVCNSDSPNEVKTKSKSKPKPGFIG